MKQIKDMFLIRKAMSFILILSLLTVPAFAATNTKSANFSCNSTPPPGFNLFHPTTGSITGTYNSASTTVSTKVNFSYTTAAVSKINAYNTSKKYTGIDMEYTENLMYTQAAEQNFNLVGITDVYAYISPNQIDELSNDNLTYLVDTSGNDSGNGITAVNDESGVTLSSVFPKSLTWELEELGLL